MTTIESYAQGAPCYVELMTPDPEAAKTFYGSLFDWNLADASLPGEGTYLTIALGDAPIAGIMSHPPQLTGHPAFWNVHLAVDDIDKTCAQVEAAGGVVEVGPFDVRDLGRTAAIQDPTQARVNLWQATKHHGTAVRGVTGSPIWNELVSPDVERAKQFYSDVLGVTWEDQSMEGMQYAVMSATDGTACAGAFQPGADMPAMPPHWNVYLAVDDVDATVAQAQALGGRAVAPAMEVPTVGRMAMLADPQGGMFWVMKPDPAMAG